MSKEYFLWKVVPQRPDLPWQQVARCVQNNILEAESYFEQYLSYSQNDDFVYIITITS